MGNNMEQEVIDEIVNNISLNSKDRIFEKIFCKNFKASYFMLKVLLNSINLKVLEEINDVKSVEDCVSLDKELAIKISKDINEIIVRTQYYVNI